MIRKIVCILLVICFFSSSNIIASAEKPIKLYMNNEQIIGIDPIMKSGIVYVPIRKTFNAIGYAVSYDAESGIVSAFIGGKEAIFYIYYYDAEYNGNYYSTFDQIIVIDGRVYLPAQLLAKVLGYTVKIDESDQNVYLLKYGYGEEEAVNELINNYYQHFNINLLTDDNPNSMYHYDDSDWYANNNYESEITTIYSSLTTDSVEYTSDNEAIVIVTSIDNTVVLNRTDQFMLMLRKEGDQWKVARDHWIGCNMVLPNNTDETVAKIIANKPMEREAVLSDLNNYFGAFNEENVELTLQYTSPEFISYWERDKGEGYLTYQWEEMLKAKFEYSDPRYKISDERVVFLGEREAVVHATIEWSNIPEGVEEGEYIFEALIDMDYANGHWNYELNYKMESFNEL